MEYFCVQQNMLPINVHCRLSAKAIFISRDAPKPADVLHRTRRNTLANELMLKSPRRIKNVPPLLSGSVRKQKVYANISEATIVELLLKWLYFNVLNLNNNLLKSIL